MKEIHIFLFVLFTLFQCAGVFAQHQLVYIGGKATVGKKDILLGGIYDASKTIVFEGERIVFFDTSKKVLLRLEKDRKGKLGDVLSLVNDKGYKCCLSSFRDFVAYSDAPYLWLYPDSPLTFGEADAFFDSFGMYLAYGILKKKENKELRAMLAQEGGRPKPVFLKKILDRLVEINSKSGVFNPVKRIVFYEYYPDAENEDTFKPIANRRIVSVEDKTIKEKLMPFYNLLKIDKSISKEDTFKLLLDFVQAVYGRPDVESFKKWLLEHCNLDFY